MTAILQGLPFGPSAADFIADNQVIKIKPYQIVCWASLTNRIHPRLPTGSKRFPVLIDTGHSGSFCLHERQLREWAGIESAKLHLITQRRVNGIRSDVREAVLWIHANALGSSKLDSTRSAVRIELPEGIEIAPASIGYPRLPLLGLRTIASNSLNFIVNGKSKNVTLDQ